MYVSVINDMDLKQIAESGQCFLWQKQSESRYSVQAFGKYIEIGQAGNVFTFSCSEEEFKAFWRDYFDIDTDYGKIKAGVSAEDTYLTQAAEYGRGIRILRQDLWEVMAGFLISQNNNITRIHRSMNLLCTTYGKRNTAEGTGCSVYHAFPGPDDMCRVTERELQEIGLGYRAKYFAALVGQMKGGGIQELKAELEKADDTAAVKLLQSIYGIGQKVADCICLFGLHRMNRFPVDTHIKRILEAHYPAGFPYTEYDGCLGVIQQYMFYYDLKNKQVSN